MSKPRAKSKTGGEIFFWPLIIGGTSAAGLISALVADGIWDAVSWALLGIPIVVGSRFSWRKN